MTKWFSIQFFAVVIFNTDSSLDDGWIFRPNEGCNLSKSNAQLSKDVTITTGGLSAALTAGE
jgi:hypothetical protein